jgi:predicted RNA-binding protein with PUA-like domain
MPFLFKEEPSNYSYDAFAKDGSTTWTGVKNPVAQKNLASVKKGDLVFYYHTGNEKQIVGIAKASGNAYPDPADKTGKAHVVDLVPVKKLKRPVTLAEIKADRQFATFALTRVPRLSVMPVTDEQWNAILRMSERA